MIGLRIGATELAEIEEMIGSMQVAPKRVIAKCGPFELSYEM